MAVNQERFQSLEPLPTTVAGLADLISAQSFEVMAQLPHFSGKIIATETGIDLDLEDLTIRYDVDLLRNADRAYLDTQATALDAYLEGMTPILQQEIADGARIVDKTRDIKRALEFTPPGALPLVRAFAKAGYWTLAIKEFTTPQRIQRDCMEGFTAGFQGHTIFSYVFERAKGLFPEHLQEEPFYKDTVASAHIHRVQASNHRKWLEAMNAVSDLLYPGE